MQILRDGSRTEDVRLDRLDDKDRRSRSYSVADLLGRARSAGPRSYTWRCKLQLDQGLEGACVGYAWTHELAARPCEVQGLSATFAREQVYHAAQRLDDFPGGAYPGAQPFSEGTSVLAGAKAVSALGYMEGYVWAFEFADLVLAVAYRGPVVFGCRWYREMRRPAEDGFARPRGRLMGNHCILLNGTVIVRGQDGEIDENRSHFSFRNSFGAGWGQGGGGHLSFADMRLLWDGAESCMPVTRHRQPAAAPIAPVLRGDSP